MVKKMNRKIFISTILLTITGIIMIYSASQVWASYKMKDEFFYLKRQIIFGIIAIGLMILISRINYHIYFKYATWIFLVLFSLLILVLIPGIGLVRGGARSWIGVGTLQIQPAEFIKLGLVIILAKFLSKYEIEKPKNLFTALSLVGITFGLIMLEPDLGTGIVMLLGIMMMMFVGGISGRYVLIFFALGAILATLLIVVAPYRINRITAYLDPWSDPLGTGFQTIQSLYAISPGGLFGLGLFNSRQKFFYLPEPQTDFIFAIILEELGLLGALMILALYFIIFYQGIMTSIYARDRFGMFLGMGITSLLFSQFFINIGVVIGLLPVTGVTLPMISYGGSSLILTLAMIGILLNISRKE